MQGLFSRFDQWFTTRAYCVVVWFECRFMYRVSAFGRMADWMEREFSFLDTTR